MDGIYGLGIYADMIISASDMTGIDPRLILGIIIKENFNMLKFTGAGVQSTLDSLKTWLWDDLGLADSNGFSIGLAQMKEDTFLATRDKHTELHGKGWSDLNNDDGLAILALAFHLKDLDSDLGPGTVFRTGAGEFTRHEMLAYGYNSGRREMINAGAGGGMDSGHYVEPFQRHYSTANSLFCGSGYFRCF